MTWPSFGYRVEGNWHQKYVRFLFVGHAGRNKKMISDSARDPTIIVGNYAAPVPLMTAGIVPNNILRSSHNDQLSI